MNRHKLPNVSRSFSFKSAQIWENLHKTGVTTRSIGPRLTKPINFKPRNGRTHHHAPPRIREDPRPSLSNLWESTGDFRKLIAPWSFTALELQNLKFSGPESHPRAYTRRQIVRLNEHAPPSDLTRRTSFKRVDVPHVPSCAIMLWMMSSSTTAVDPDWPRNLTRSESPVKRK